MLVILLLLVILLIAWILAIILGSESQASAIGNAIRSLFVQAPAA
ncbi:hypothetical protein ACFYKT_06235 [Cytobacillus sp. FJAT-53684]|uniref:Lmo0937 family membrane protein n=1 Tax=Cytobacillus mangrovibacter TaxID=3299024 RepID=A0ABW6JWU1_9BACI